MTLANFEILPEGDLGFSLDLKKQFALFEKNEKKFIKMEKLRAGKKITTTTIRGELCTAGINTTEFMNDDESKRQVYSIGMTIDESAEESLAEVQNVLVDLCATHSDDWEVSELVKEDSKLFIKIKPDGSGKGFNFKSNLKLTPKQFSDASMASRLTFHGEILAWFNLRDKKCGLTLVPKSLLFDEDEDSTPTKKQKRE